MKFLSNPLKLSIPALALASLANSAFANSEPAYEPMANYHAASIFAQVGAPVGRLNIHTDKGRFTCTGFLISNNHVMTNHHCIDDVWYDRKKKQNIPQKVQRVEMEFGFVDPGNKANIRKYNVRLPAIEKNKALDYAILTIENQPADQFGYLSIATTLPEAKMPLWIIGHPRGKAQQISRIKCQSIIPVARRQQRIQHTCPAVPGSSGSPVFDASTGQVIAIHHASLGDGSKDVGLAVPFADIAKHSPLLRDILENQ